MINLDIVSGGEIIPKEDEVQSPQNNITLPREGVINIMSEKTSHGFEDKTPSSPSKSDRVDALEGGGSLISKTYKPLPTQASIIKEVKEAKDFSLVKQDNFWKTFSIISLLAIIILAMFYLGNVRNGNFKSEIQPLTEINNSYSFTPSISSPVTSEISNQYNNTYSINFDLDDELINKFCNNS